MSAAAPNSSRQSNTGVAKPSFQPHPKDPPTNLNRRCAQCLISFSFMSIIFLGVSQNFGMKPIGSNPCSPVHYTQMGDEVRHTSVP